MSVVTQTKVASPFTAVPPVYTAAASAAAGAAETFTIKPDCDDIREVILVRNGSTDKTVTVYFECNENAPRPTTAAQTIGPGTECAIAVDSALLKKADGGFSLVAVPPASSIWLPRTMQSSVKSFGPSPRNVAIASFTSRAVPTAIPKG